MQTSTDVTKQPDALEAIRHAVQVLVCGGISVPPDATFVAVGDGLKQNVWGGSGMSYLVKNATCLVSAVDHENSVKNRNFVKLTANECILDDFRCKSHQNSRLTS